MKIISLLHLLRYLTVAHQPTLLWLLLAGHVRMTTSIPCVFNMYFSLYKSLFSFHTDTGLPVQYTQYSLCVKVFLQRFDILTVFTGAPSVELKRWERHLVAATDCSSAST